jgi:hypothetical protein
MNGGIVGVGRRVWPFNETHMDQDSIVHYCPQWTLLRILWCNQIGNHPENNLAKFGSIVKYVGRKKKNRFPLGYLLEVMINILAIWKFQKIRNLATLGHFFPWKILCIGRNPILQVEIWRKFTSKRNTGSTGRFNWIWLQPKYKSNFFKNVTSIFLATYWTLYRNVANFPYTFTELWLLKIFKSTWF